MSSNYLGQISSENEDVMIILNEMKYLPNDRA